MNDICLNCKTILVAFLEKKFNECTNCLESKIKNYNEFKYINELNSKNLEVTISRLTAIEDKQNKFKKILEIKNQGKEAFKRQITFLENPYKDGSEEFDLWAIGWVSCEKEQINLRLKSDILKALEVIDHIKNLSVGYGQTEIAEKLDLLPEILLPHTI